MSVQVRKFPLDRDTTEGIGPATGIFQIEMPVDAEIVHVGITGAQSCPCIWAICNSESHKTTWTFVVKMTDENMEDILRSGYKHVATFSWVGNLVWHLFQVD